jgi:hypothetical protein
MRFLVCLLLAGCSQAELSTRDVRRVLTDGDVATADAAPDADRDAAPDRDASADPDGTPRLDAAPADCPGGCGAHASCQAGACRCDPDFFPDPDPRQRCAPPDPCAGVACGANARCTDGACACLPGFEGPSCAPATGGPLESRTREEVCARWRADRVDASPEWTPGGADACDPGSVPDPAQQNGLRRTNLYRWLAGLPPAGLDAGHIPVEQACAALENGLGHLDHFPPEGSPCYSADGAAGAGSSNLAQGTGLADSVDLFVDDGGVPSLGHRRWVLSATLGNTAFGHRPPFTCMYAFDMSGQTDLDFIAWPPPGYVPDDAAHGRWSFVALRLQPAGPVSVDLSVDGGAPQTYAAEELPVGYGGQYPSYAFDPPAEVWADGREARVTVHGLSGGDVSYTVRFTACR